MTDKRPFWYIFNVWNVKHNSSSTPNSNRIRFYVISNRYFIVIAVNYTSIMISVTLCESSAVQTLCAGHVISVYACPETKIQLYS